jgi:uncharacterized protein
MVWKYFQHTGQRMPNKKITYMTVYQEYNEKNGRFFMVDEQTEIAFMTYVYAPPKAFIIEHTIVSEAWEGKGLGSMLVKAAVDFAREKGLKIIPLCPYAAVVFKRKTEYADVLK